MKGNQSRNIKELLKDSNISDSVVIPGIKDVDFAIRVSGNGMYPKYSNGDILICRDVTESSFIQWGKAYVIVTESSGVLVRRLNPSDIENNVKAETFSEDYPPFNIPKEDIYGLAIVVASIKFE